MAAAIQMPLAEFERSFVRRVGNRMSLVEFADGDCVFFDPEHRRCRLYRVRPRQCRTWPFWRSNLRTPESWDLVRRECPGAGCGEMVTCEEIESRATVMQI